MNWGLLFVLYLICVFYFLPTLNIYLYECLTEEIDIKDVSIFQLFKKSYNHGMGGGILPLTALPFPCFSSEYHTPELKKICHWRNISSTIMVLHFAALIIIAIFFAPEVTEFFNKD